MILKSDKLILIFNKISIIMNVQNSPSTTHPFIHKELSMLIFLAVGSILLLHKPNNPNYRLTRLLGAFLISNALYQLKHPTYQKTSPS